MRRDEDLVLCEFQSFRKHTDQCGIECQRTALKRNRLPDLKPLRQTADRLFCDGMKSRQGDICFRHSLVQERLDICLRIHSTPPGDIVNAGSFRSHRVKLPDRDLQYRGDLIDKGACPARAASVHTHIRHSQCAGGGILLKEDHLRILAAKLDRAADRFIPVLQRSGICRDFLDERQIQLLRDRLRAGSGQSEPELCTRKFFLQLLHYVYDALYLVGMMPPVVRIYDGSVFRIENYDLCRSGTDIDPGCKCLSR